VNKKQLIEKIKSEKIWFKYKNEDGVLLDVWRRIDFIPFVEFSLEQLKKINRGCADLQTTYTGHNLGLTISGAEITYGVFRNPKKPKRKLYGWETVKNLEIDYYIRKLCTETDESYSWYSYLSMAIDDVREVIDSFGGSVPQQNTSLKQSNDRINDAKEIWQKRCTEFADLSGTIDTPTWDDIMKRAMNR
jgi:hypothetical protein